jgi:alkyl hydroperoxide reductase subunit AhpC
MAIPMLSWRAKLSTKDYGCLIEDGPDAGVSFRATYIIDGNGVLRHMSINDLPVGRNADEYVRLVQAFKYTDEFVCCSEKFAQLLGNQERPLWFQIMNQASLMNSGRRSI